MSRDDLTIEYFFDIGSPYSYLASTQIEQLEEETGVPVEWRPFLLGGVFQATGNAAPARIEEKAQYMLQDLNRWANRYDVDFRMSPHFPINSLLTQRALVAAGRLDEAVEDLAKELYRRYWVENVDVSEAGAVASAAEEVGLDGEEIVAMTQDQGVKDELRENSDEAVERGAFGAPTFFVEDEMFWGNDRLHFLREAVAARR